MTRALDTNVVVRFLAADDREQSTLAEELLSQAFLISPSVLMECEWVLRSSYQWSRQQIALAFRSLLDLPGFVAVPPEMRWIVDRFEAGADFADMVHLSGANGATAFATFDSRIAGAAGPSTPVPIETLG